MNKIEIWLLLLLFWLPLSCKTHGANAPDISKSNKIIVTYDDQITSKRDLPLKTITDKNSVDLLVEFTMKNVLTKSTVSSDWCRTANVQGRSTYIDASFYQENSYIGSVGIGRYDADHFFLEFLSFNFVKGSCISTKEKDDLLLILGINSSENYDLRRRLQ